MITKILMSVFLCLLSTPLFGSELLPQYPGHGPQNVYYLSWEGDYLFGGIDYARLQDGWHLPYVALRDAYEKKGYKFIAFRPDTFQAMFRNQNNDFLQNFVNNTYAMFSEGLCFEPSLVNLLGKRLMMMLLESHHWSPEQSNPAVLQKYSKLLTWKPELVDNKKFFEFYYVQSKLELIDNIVPFKDKKLCALVAKYQVVHHPNELYSKRAQAADFFEAKAPHEFGLYGRDWNSRRHYTSYKSVPSSKTETLRQYKFSICYEGSSDQNGYVTEKIFGSLAAGCVPIYWGAPDIERYVPKSCFIDMRNFQNLNDLYNYISHMSEEEYNTYLVNIKNYFASPQCYKFSIDFFVKNLIRIQLS